jgi:mitochondrial inner membrane protease subunit 1
MLYRYLTRQRSAMIQDPTRWIVQGRTFGLKKHQPTILQPLKKKFNSQPYSTSCLIRSFSSKTKTTSPSSSSPSSSSASSTSTKNLSRTDRRVLLRKERNQSKRIKQKQENADRIQQGRRPPQHHSASSSLKSLLPTQFNQHFQNRYRWFISRMPRWLLHFPGRSFGRDHWVALFHRLPWFFLMCYCITDENMTPYAVKPSLGPSMLPTIQFCGDLWLVETGAWTRAWREVIRLISNRMNQNSISQKPASSATSTADNDDDDMQEPAIGPNISFMYNVGDLLLWEDSSGRMSCKRLIGKEGDTVQRYGQFAATIYRQRPDLGIIWPSDAKERGLGSDPNAPKSWDTSVAVPLSSSSLASASASNDEFNDEIGHTQNDRMADTSRKLIVPKGCVWLEGDCPLFSVDSRQYGPISTEHIRGRLLFRLWPWKRTDLLSDDDNAYLSSCTASRQRPIPYQNVESYLGRRFGFYRIPKKRSERQTL